MNLGPTGTWVTIAVAKRDGTVSLHQAWDTHPIAMNASPGLRFKGTAGLLMDRYTGISNGGSDCDKKHGHELPVEVSNIVHVVTCPQKRLDGIGSGYSRIADYKTMLAPVLIPHLTGSYKLPAEDAKSRTKLVFSPGSTARAMPRLSVHTGSVASSSCGGI
ncbi:hypothetical protein K438DRAFT_1750318 [Mycena galopus ATCC 62051]|nr:hypothetical protein K438DRAFT_1750318 [Mycena galopus ATCC 62051]